jgi:antitoxin HicB
MNNNALNDVTHYMGLPYTIILKRDDEGDFVCRVEELKGCTAHGKTEIEALGRLKEAQQLWILDCLESGDPVPAPKEEKELPFSGRWVQRVARSLHKALTDRAKREGVSLNHLVSEILAKSVGESVMAQVIDASLMARFASHQVKVSGVVAKHIDSVWNPVGHWTVYPQKHYSHLTHQIAGVMHMTPAPCTVIYHDDEKETSNLWPTTIR